MILTNFANCLYSRCLKQTTLPIYRHANWVAGLSNLGSSTSFQAHSSDFVSDMPKQSTPARRFRIAVQYFYFHTTVFLFAFHLVNMAAILDKHNLSAFCGMPECRAARPSFYHAVSPEMPEPRLDDSAAQSTWRYTDQVLRFKHQEYRHYAK